MKTLITTFLALTLLASQVSANVVKSKENPTMAHTVTLNWTASTDKVDGYNIYRGTVSGQESTLLDASPVTATTFVDSAPLLGTSYYVVRSIVNGLESVNSNEITVQLRPAAPTQLTGVAN